jgi:glyoxylase-like metal-dependent hydrolase (beta-lactamase superfamily II)
MLNTKVLVLDNDCEVLPGHGPNTTIGDEKNFNPFLM